MDSLRLAVVGCGAIARGVHLPAVRETARVEAVALVDNDLERARELASQFGVDAVYNEHSEIYGKVDAAIVAVPNRLHAQTSIDLLENGVHVLVEKPMALSAADCARMQAAQKSSGRTLAVGLSMRWGNSARFVKQVVANGWLGEIVRFDLRRGEIFSWPLASDSLLRKESAGGGVLLDIGSHVLDALLWWMGDWKSVEYRDDAVGGVEADCELELELECGARGVVELSRTRDLRNSCILEGTAGRMEVVLGMNPTVRLWTPEDGMVVTGKLARETADGPDERSGFGRQLEDFVDAILSERAPFVSANEGSRAVGLIEACYAQRSRLEKPWLF